MAGDQTTRWEEATTDWTSGEPARFVELLAYAYSGSHVIRRVAEAAGLPWAAPPVAASAKEAWAGVLNEATKNGRVLDLVAVVLHDDESASFHPLLRTLLGDQLRAVHARIVARYGLPPAPTDGSDWMVESIVTDNPPPAGAPMGQLQAISSVGAGLANPRAAVQAMVDAMRRTAMIEVAGQPRGTGFLVHEQLVLTAAHVLDARAWPPARELPVQAVFDYQETAGRSPAETGTRVPVAELVTGSLPTVAEADGWVAGDWDAPEDRLDFALLRLAKAVPPPREADAAAGARGHYQLDQLDYDFGASTHYTIVQHALGEFMSLTDITASPQQSATGTRIRYGGNTLPGSSGSPLIDRRGRLVALHHFSEGRQNQGVPISVIARVLLNGEHARHFVAGVASPTTRTLARVDPFNTSAIMGGRRPFVNRHNLRTVMREMAEQRNGPRTMAIKGESGTGVSYSYMLTSHVAEQSTLCASLCAAAPGGLVAVKVDLRDYINVNVDERRARIAEVLLMELGIIKDPSDSLAQDARDTTWLKATVGSWLKRVDRQWWLFFDSIDNLVAVKQGEVDELIHALILLAEDVQVPLRVVLAGRAAEEFALEHTGGWAERDDALSLTRGDVEDWLRKRADEEDRKIDEALLEAKLSELFPAPGPLPEPRGLGPRLPKALLEVLAP